MYGSPASQPEFRNMMEYNQDYPYFEEGEAEKYIASTSVRERRIADPGSVPLIFASQRLNALLRI